MLPAGYEPTRVAIAYADGSIKGCTTPLGWRRHPDHGVQIVASWPGPPAPHLSRWTGVADRYLWTGDEEYDPFGWGLKYGQLIPDGEYQRIWDEVAYGDL